MANQTDGWENLGAYLFYVVQGSVTGSSNLLITISIMRYSALLYKKQYTVILGLSLADSISQFCYVIAGKARLAFIIILFRTFPCFRYLPQQFGISW